MEIKNSDNITLKLFNLPNINTVEDLSNQLRISKHLIYQLSKFSDDWYKTYEIAKKSGGKRRIAQPSIILKGVQTWILNEILYKIKSSNYSTAYEIGNSIVTNAKTHQGNSVLMLMDLKDFFDTISAIKVYNLFKKIGYNSLISSILTKLTTFNGYLPQGGVCSGKLANLISWSLDSRISGLCAKRGLNFSRYADDIAISGAISKSVKSIIPTVYKIVKSEGFKINYKKTRLLDKSCRRYITGLTLYDETFGVGVKFKREIRSAIFRFLFNLKYHNEFEARKINGYFNYLNAVDRARLIQLIKYSKKLCTTKVDLVLKAYKISFIDVPPNIKKMIM